MYLLYIYIYDFTIYIYIYIYIYICCISFSFVLVLYCISFVREKQYMSEKSQGKDNEFQVSILVATL